MRVATIFKVPNCILDDTKAMTVEILSQKEDVFIEYLQKSIRVMNPVVQIAQCGDDIVKDISSILIRFDGYKIPRIIKKRLKRIP